MRLKRSRVEQNPTLSMLYLTDKKCRDWLWMPRQVFLSQCESARSIFVVTKRFEIENGDSAMSDAKQFLVLQHL